MSSTTNSVASAVEPPVEQTGEPRQKKSQYRGKRGKPSFQKHTDKFRQRVGTKVVEEHRAKVRENTFSDIDDTIKQLTNLCINNTPITVQLPTTTRGLGLLVNAAYMQAEANVKGVLPISKNAFYRVTLAQFALQMIRSQMENQGVTSPDMIPYQYPESDLTGFEQTVASHTTTLRPLALAINSIGVFQNNGIRYKPIVPDSCVVASGTASTAASTSGPAQKRARRTPTCGPDPYVVTLNNLRPTVLALANPQTPEAVRNYFRAHCAIPGALWSEDDRLVNPDAIAPNNYTSAQLRHEFRQLGAMVARLSGKFNHMIGTLNYSGQGSAAQLVSSYTDSYLLPEPDGDVLHSHYMCENEDHFALQPISSQLSAIGVLTLAGEYPDHPDFEPPGGNAKSRGVYSSRYQPLQTQRYPVQWDAVVDGVLDKH